MRGTTTFLCGIDQVTLSITSRRGEKFSDDYFVTKDTAKIGELISAFGNGLGSVETKYLLHRAAAVIYRVEPIRVDPAENVGEMLDQKLVQDMLKVKGLEAAMWLIKDNACHFDRAWLAFNADGQITVNNNFWASRKSCADGTFRAVGFSSEELRIARCSERPAGEHIVSAGAPTMLAKGSLRFQRFEYFIGAARDSMDVAMKLAQYCSGLEALVSTAQQELSHQVSERVAALLAGPGGQRLPIYKLVKQAYGYRSKAVHGAPFKSADVNQLRDCATGIDQICRDLTLLYFGTDARFRDAIESSDQHATEFFLEALFEGVAFNPARV
ncbi:hypothetical protein ASF00_17675 [Sphingomonas sp. Leaf34]|uniref:HEPN domain-containing protein n=1 Tax=Sphingomonas sp. Leaf34 TaxID=1736216 RepID=UPI0006FD0F31|nr:HEPN domain-containing protein [Sphingomonas sp. Leaf34]KQN24032.1 hypothetical protein ASF00_17675 [Sphingomonas sp. Leaf34]